MSILNLLQAVRTVRKAESLDARQIQQLQKQRFRKLLRHTLRNSRFYRKYYNEHGIFERDVDAVQLEDLPVIDKNLMMENYDDFVADSALKQSDLEQFIQDSPKPRTKYKDDYVVLHTSGSSGTIGLFVYGPREWAISKALSLRITGVNINYLRKKRIAFIGATDGHFATVTAFQDLPRLIFKLLPLSISDPLERICGQIDQFQPDALTGYASGVNLLAQEQIAGRINIAPKELWCTGDLLTPVMRTRIKKAFGVNPVNVYGSTETMAVSAECGDRHQLHFFEDWFSLQVVDDDLKPASSGKAIITNLYNYTQPLIRYQMDDVLVLSNKPCQCDWPFPVIETIAGRHEEFLWFTKTNGMTEFIHPIVLAEFFVPGLEKFQFTQTSPNTLVLKAIVRDERSNIVVAIRKKMHEILLEKSLVEHVRFDIELVDEIRSNPKTGKFKLIIPFARQISDGEKL